MLFEKYFMCFTTHSRCTTANGQDADSINFGIKFNFEFVDDSYEVMTNTDAEVVGSSYVPKPPFNEDSEVNKWA